MVRSVEVGGRPIRNTTKVGYGGEDRNGDNFGVSANAFQVGAAPEFNAADFTQLNPTSRDVTIRNRNFYAITTFDIKDRYLIDGLVRRDGSSLFGPDSRWQTYYPASAPYPLPQSFHTHGTDKLKLPG